MKRWYLLIAVAAILVAAVAIFATVTFESRPVVSPSSATSNSAALSPDSVCTSSTSIDFAPLTKETPTSTSTSAPIYASAPLKFGIAVSGSNATAAAQDKLSQSIGETPSLVMAYFDFEQPPPMAMLKAVAARGQTLVISWEPWKWGGGTTQPDFQTKNITAGNFDSYLTTWAKALAGWKLPVYIRFGQEMNLANYPWTDGANGNAVGDYVTAWRHVHDLFELNGARNVSWMWSPNVPTHLSQPLSQVFPGRSYVDVLALDGYNWGNTQSWSSWVNPCKLFGEGLTDLRSLAPGAPIMIAETGCAETGGDKAVWSRQLVEYLSREPGVDGLIMFNQDKEVDWRIDSPASALAALAAALRSRKHSG